MKKEALNLLSETSEPVIYASEVSIPDALMMVGLSLSNTLFSLSQSHLFSISLLTPYISFSL